MGARDIRAFGVAGIRERLAEHCRLGRLFAGLVDEHPGFTRMAPVLFSTVCFRAVWPGRSDEETDRVNEQMLERINSAGRVFLSHTRLHGRYTLRLAIGNLRTEERHVRLAWECLLAERKAMADPPAEGVR